MAETDVNTESHETDEETAAQQVDWEAKYKEAVEQSRKWESRAKRNSDKAKKWDEYEQQGMTEAEKLAKRAEDAEAELEKLRAKAQHDADMAEVSKETGVPVQLLAFCADRESMEAFAKEYGTEHKTPAAAPAPESRVLRGGGAKKSNADLFAESFGDLL